jgi:hypothetical protein
MTDDAALAQFEASLGGDAAPSGMAAALEALWWDAKGDWEKAHHCAQSEQSAASAWVHAYLHRKEGDLANAAYWYRRAGKSMAQGALASEWRTIVGALTLAQMH